MSKLPVISGADCVKALSNWIVDLRLPIADWLYRDTQIRNRQSPICNR